MSSLAQTYDRVSELQFEEGRRLVERLGLREGSRVLDVGCGTGRLTQAIAERIGPTGAATGIDPEADRVQFARSRGGRATFVVGRAEDLGCFEDASFDAVCMSAVFHWVTDKARALAEVRRVLRPGGRLGVTTPPLELARATTLSQVLAPLFARAPYAGRIDRSMLTLARGNTTTELVSLVLESQLDLAELQLTPRAQTFANGGAVLAFIEASAFGTFLSPVPEELRSSLRSELVAAFEKRSTAVGVALHGWSALLVATRS